MDMSVIINVLRRQCISGYDATEFWIQRVRTIRYIYVKIANDYKVCMIGYIDVIKVFTELV